MKTRFYLTISLLLFSFLVYSQGPFAFYPFNGNANDESGNLQNGSIFGPILTDDRLATLNSAYLFDGINDQINLPFSPSGFNQISITAWVFRTKNSAVGVNQGIVSNDVAANRGVLLGIDPNNSLLISINNTSLVQSQVVGGFIPLSQWSFVAMTYDGATLSLYQDGVLQGSTAANGILNGISNFQIGHDLFDGLQGRFLGGKIDQVRVYDRGLSALEVENIRLGIATVSNYTNINASLTGVDIGDADWGDYDGDGDLDIIATGRDFNGLHNGAIYRNDAGTFSNSGIVIPQLFNSNLEWGDFDGDKDLDLVITGQKNPGEWLTFVYENDGFNLILYDTLNTSQTLPNSTVAWIDYDADGDLDVLQTSEPTMIFENFNGTFVEIDPFTTGRPGLPGLTFADVDLGDFNNDGLTDILYTGFENGLIWTSALFFSNGTGDFSAAPFSPTIVSNGSVTSGDYDNDGDLDIFLMGEAASFISEIYRNDGGGFFTKINPGLTGITEGDATWGDYDNDGDLDILVSGFDGVDIITVIFRNDGSDVFTEVDEGLIGTQNGSVNFGDYDADGDLDILLTGIDDVGDINLAVFQNTGAPLNSAPTVPGTPTATVDSNDRSVFFQWSFASDDFTPDGGISYNMKIGTFSGGDDVIAAHVNANNTRLISEPGNIGNQLLWILFNLDPGVYYYSIQAIDGAFQASAFSPESTFEILPDVNYDLIAYYPFTGSAFDASGNTNDGIPSGGTLLTTDFYSATDAAYEFDGIDDRIGLPLISEGLKAFSITAWVFRTKNDDFIWQGIVGNDGEVDRGIYLDVDDFNDLAAGITTTEGEFVLWGNPVPESQWMSLSMTYDGREIKIYQDAILTNSTPANGLVLGTRAFEIGWDIFEVDWYFGGKIDEVRIYNRALVQAEVDELHFPPLPDLSIISSTANPRLVLPGSNIGVLGEIRNNGGDAGNSSTLVYLSTDQSIDGDDIFLQNIFINPISGISNERFNGIVTIPLTVSTGSYFLLFEADGNLEVPESDETNNVQSVSIEVVTPGSPANINWNNATSFGNIVSLNTDEVLSMAQDINDNIYMVGFTNDGTFENILIQKVDAGLIDLGWTTYSTGIGNSHANDIATDASGNYYIIGEYFGTLDFGNSVIISSNGGSQDAFLVKFNSSGLAQWARTFGGTNSDRGMGIDLDNFGNVYITGINWWVDYIFASLTTTNLGTADGFVAKYDNLGNELWARNIGGTDEDKGLAIAVDDNGYSHIAGYSVSPDINIGGFFVNNPDPGFREIFLARIDPNGAEEWIRNTGGLGDDDIFDIGLDPFGNVFISGSIQQNSLADFDSFGTPFSFLANAGVTDIFLAKYSGNGVSRWSRNYGAISNDDGKALVIDNNGDVFLTGLHNGSNMGTIDLTSTAGSYITKVNGANGNPIWAGGLIDGEFSEGRDLLLDTKNNLYLAGVYRTSIAFPNLTNLFSSGGTDIYITTIAPSPDITVEQTTLSKGFAYDGERIELYAEIVNQGEATAGTFNVDILLSDTPDLLNFSVVAATLNIASLGPGQRQIISAPYDVPTGILPGTYYVTIVANNDRSLAEITQDNNIAQIQIEVIDTDVVPPSNFEWVSGGGTPGTDFGYEVAVDPSGNIFVVGQMEEGTANISGITLTSFGGRDIFLAKYDPDGNIIWATNAGSSSVNADIGIGLGLDSFGNVYITGWFYETANFQGLTVTSAGNADIFLAKYDTNGTILWVRKAGGGSDFDQSFSLDVTNKDEIFLTGIFLDPITFETVTLNGDGTVNAFVAKYDTNGNLFWAMETGLGGFTLSRRISVDDNFGESYITGRFIGQTTFGSTVLNSNGGNDIFVAKINDIGTVLWAKTFGGAGFDYGRSIHYDSNNPTNLYVTGYFTETIDFAGTTLNPTGSGQRDMFITQLDGNTGDPFWVKQLESSVSSFGDDITTDTQGIVYVTGGITGSTTQATGSLVSNGEGDVTLLIYQPDGTLSSATNTGGTNNDFGIAITYNDAISPSIYTTGSITGTADFNSSIVTGNGGLDFFVAKAPADAEPPTVTTDFPPFISLGQIGQNASVTVSDNLGVSSVEVFYLGITEPISNTQSVVLDAVPDASGSGGTYSFDLNVTLDLAGIEYLFVATDVSGNQTVLSGKSLIRYEGISELSLNYNQTGFGKESYEIFSVPLSLDQSSIRDIFVDDLGPVDNSRWRIFSYENGSARDISSSGSIRPGKGYWIIVKDGGVSISLGPGAVPNLNQAGPFEVSTFQLSLTQGWNQIGNPYAFSLNWGDILTYNGITTEIDPELWIYSSGYIDNFQLDPFDGAFIFVNNAINIDLPALINTTDKNARTSGVNRQQQSYNNSLDSEEWGVDIHITKGSINNTRAGFGMSPDAHLSKDHLDRITLPRFQDFVEMNFDHPEYFADKFARDFVPTSENHKWEFEINSSNTGEKVILSWDNSYFGNNDQELILYDVDAKRKINMRVQSEYSFMGDKRNFEVYYGDALFISEFLKPQELVSIIYPNPASHELTFQLGLPDSQGDYGIDIKIFNSMGQIIDRINVKDYAPGFHDIKWDIRNNKTDIPTGLYFYKISIDGISEHKDLTGRLIIKE